MLTDFVTGYDHIGIPTNDMEATVKFYETIGFKLVHATPVWPLIFTVQLALIVFSASFTSKSTAHLESSRG